MNGVDEYRKFYAICNHPPLGDHAIRVGGTVCFRTSGWEAHLQPTRGNVGINPTMLHLDLVITAPDPGEGIQEVITCSELDEWRANTPTIEYTEVEFHVRGSGDEPPPILSVEHVT